MYNENLNLVAKLFPPVDQEWQKVSDALARATVNPQLTPQTRAFYATALDFDNFFRIVNGIARLAEKPKRRRKRR